MEFISKSNSDRICAACLLIRGGERMRYIIAFAVLRSIPWSLEVSEFASCMVVVSDVC
jgi:hypothetical protein